MNIRCVNADDAVAFSSLRREVAKVNPVQMGLTYEEELTRTIDSFKKQLSFSSPNAMFGGFVEGRLVATAAVGMVSKFPSSRHKMVMWGVFTSSLYRRQGLSRQVVGAAIEHAFEHGVRRINLQVYVPNDPAINLYKSLGFTKYGVEPEALFVDDLFFDSVHMTLVSRQA